MNELLPTFDLALQYNDALPERIRRYLEARGIPGSVQDRFVLGWNGERITIPIYDREGRLASFRLARDPDSEDGPKVLATPGARAELYGWEHLRKPTRRLIVCEGEYDRLVLEAQDMPAVTSTGGAGTFRQDWADALKEVPEVYLCFDRDVAGRRGALRVGRLVPHARLVTLPEAVGKGGDVTDFFVRLGRSREEFLGLLEEARPVPQEEDGPADAKLSARKRLVHTPSGNDRKEIERLKASDPLEVVVGRQVTLRPGGGRYFIGQCPFHDDRTPSFVLYPESRHFHCYGCGAHGDVISYLMRAEGLTFPEALDALRRLAR